MSFAVHLAAAAALCLLPDIVPEGVKGIRVALRVNPAALGPFTERACLLHVIAAGETLEAIAKARLGDATRWPEIADLNPDVEPNRLVVGKGLWLPPRRVKAGEEPVLLFSGNIAFVCHFEALPVNGEVPTRTRGGELSLLVVPLSARKELEAALASPRDRRTEIEKLAKARKIHLLTAAAPSHLVDRSSPVAGCSAAYRIAIDATGQPQLEQVSVELFAADGKPVPKGAARIDGAGSKGDGPGPQPEKGSLLLLPIGLLGAGGLLLRSRARGRSPNV